MSEERFFEALVFSFSMAAMDSVARIRVGLGLGFGWSVVVVEERDRGPSDRGTRYRLSRRSLRGPYSFQANSSSLLGASNHSWPSVCSLLDSVRSLLLLFRSKCGATDSTDGKDFGNGSVVRMSTDLDSLESSPSL